MRKLLSIFMSVVMVVTMLPKMSFAEVGKTESTANEEQQVGGTEDKKGNANPHSEGTFKYLQDKFSLLTGFLKEKAPEVWDSLKPYVEQGKNWGKDYYNNVSEFASKVGVLGVAATVALPVLAVGLFALAVKVVWKFIKFILTVFKDEESKQVGRYAPYSLYSANSGQAAAYTYSNGGYQTPYSYMA